MTEVRLPHNAEYIDRQGNLSIDVQSLFNEQRRRLMGGIWNPASIQPVFKAIYYEIRWMDSGREMSAIKSLTYDPNGKSGNDGLVDVVMTSDKDPHVEHTQYRLFESYLPEKERLTISQPDPNDPLAPWITRFGVVGSNTYRETKEARELAEEFTKRREAAFDMDKDLRVSGMPGFEAVSEQPVKSFWHQEEIYPGDKAVKKPSAGLKKDHDFHIKAFREEEKRRKDLLDAQEKANAENEKQSQLARLRSALGTRREKIEKAQREESARKAYADQIERLGEELDASLRANEEDELEKARKALALEVKSAQADPKRIGKAPEMSPRKSRRLKQARSQIVKNDKTRMADARVALKEMGPIFEDQQIEIWTNLADELDSANKALARDPFLTPEDLEYQYSKRITEALYEGEERQRWLDEFNSVGKGEGVIVFDGLKDHIAGNLHSNGNGHKDIVNKEDFVLPEGTRLLKMKNGQQRLQRIKDGKFVGKDGKTKKERGEVNGIRVDLPKAIKDKPEETDQIQVAVGVRITKTSHVSS